MDAPSDSQSNARRDAPAKPAPLGLNKIYLVMYNALSAQLWAVILVRVVTILTLHGYGETYDRLGEWVKWTQTLAVLEIVHSLVGTSALQHHDNKLQSNG